MTGEVLWRASRTWTFPASTASIAAARAAVADELTATAFADRVDDVRLLISELVTNAVVHASSTFAVTCCWHTGLLRVEVADHSADAPVVQPLTLTEANGRGLFIVQAIAARWGVLPRDDGGKTVWFELDPR